MDYMTDFLKTTRRSDSIWVIIDRMTKLTHFILIKISYTLQKLAEVYINEIMKLHCIPSSIVSDTDLRFTSRFWQSLQEDLGTKLRLSFAYHPQTEEIIQQTSEKIGMIQENLEASQTRQKSYSDKRRKELEFQEGDRVFFRVTPFDEVQFRENLTVKGLSLQIENREVKHLRGKEIASVKVRWGGPVDGSVTWELDSQMKESYPELFHLENMEFMRFGWRL
ncbi:uncharacterized protein LOC127095573 [Lathyrus oleraceus]|uniref:uncharacterized protein LOC127095573 n=1 Tax=Pisum sativum TaxID=3888 RepID=UPI0021D30AA1|nr:uncharacterized protein LOC127095573 [Pisum sativum]